MTEQYGEKALRYVYKKSVGSKKGMFCLKEDYQPLDR